MGRQLLRMNDTEGTQIEKRFEVSLLRPAHIPDRVVVAALLELRVIPSRAVRTGDDKRQLLVIVIVTRNIHSRYAHHHDLGPVAGNAGRQFDRRVTLGRSCDEHGVGPPAASGLNHRLFDGRAFTGEGSHRSIGNGLFGTLGRDIETNHATATCLEQHDRQLAD